MLQHRSGLFEYHSDDDGSDDSDGTAFYTRARLLVDLGNDLKCGAIVDVSIDLWEWDVTFTQDNPHAFYVEYRMPLLNVEGKSLQKRVVKIENHNIAEGPWHDVEFP